ncbi:MAG: InlB B-repeat-containing protein [Candidatus Methanoplasma sp.]|nr:InlB B-repeat-containing protein [Candidatus Methanoplasma sp.]
MNKRHMLATVLCLAVVCAVAFVAMFAVIGSNYADRIDWSVYESGDDPWIPKENLDPDLDEFSLKVTTEGDGTVNRTDSVYFFATIAILEAVPGEGHVFGGWYIDNVLMSMEKDFSMILNEDRSVTALFVIPDIETHEYTLKITVINTVTEETPGHTDGEGTYNAYDTATLSAVSETGYKFVGWYVDGSVLSDEQEYEVEVFGDLDIEARFVPANCTVLVSVSSDTVSEPGRVSGSGEYRYNSSATLGSVTYPGYVFDGWYSEDVLLSKSSEYDFRITENRTISAHFSVDHDASFSVEKSSEFAPSVVTVTGTPGGEIVQRTWTLTDALTEKYLGSYYGDSFSRSFDSATAVKITQSVTYSDGYTSESSCTEVVDGLTTAHYEWKYMAETWYSGILGFNNRTATYDAEYRFSEYFLYADSELSRSGPKTQDWIENFVTSEDPAILALAQSMISSTSGMSQLQRAQYVSNFVQTAITYEYDDVKGPTEYYKFPYETLYEGRGDCEDSALLYISLMKAMGYDTALLRLNYTNSGHAVPMVVIEGASGYSFEYDGKTFVCCEVTSDPKFFQMFSKDIGDKPNGWEKGAQLTFYHLG